MTDRRSFGARELALAACVLAAALLVVFWTPIASYGSHTFAPVDLASQSNSLTRVEGHRVFSNNLLPDPVLEMHPWALFNRGELAAGRAPLWNPYNACGVPHLANYQSAPFSPFAVPFYVLPFKAALIVASFAKLLALALFAYLFLHQIGLARFAAWCGALAFATSGFALLLHQYPHVGAMLAVPGGLYFAERVLQELEDGVEHVSLGSLAGLALVLATAALAGHPETLGYGLVVLAAYCAWRAFGLFRSESIPRARTLRACAALVVAGVIGGGMALVQLVPFAEYLARSATLTTERGTLLALSRENWPLLVFPNLAGTPVQSQNLAMELPAPNYEEFTSFYVGGVVLLCAAIGAWFSRRDRRTAFFAACVIAWALYAWNVFGIATWLGRATPLGLVPIHRTHPLWTPAVCVLAAVAIDRIERATIARRGLAALATLAAGALALVLFRWGAERYLERAVVDLGVERAIFPASIEPHVLLLTLAFAAGVVGIALLFASSHVVAKYAGRALVLAALFLESGWALRDYVPTVEDRFSYPRTAAIEALREQVGDERWIALTTDTLRPDANLVYGLSMLTNYDALDVAEYHRLLKHFFGGQDTLRASKTGLALFGVSYVATKSEWVPIDTELADVIVERFDATAYLLSELQPERALSPLAEVTRERPWRFEFAASRGGFDSLCLHVLDDPSSRDRSVIARLFDVASEGYRCEITRPISSLHRLPDGHLELVLECPETQGRTFVIEVSSPDATDDASIKIARGGKGKGYQPREPGGEREAGPALDLGYDSLGFQRVGEFGEHVLWRVVPSHGRAWVVENAKFASSAQEAFEQVTAADFDPYYMVVLEGSADAKPGRASTSRVELLEQTPTRQRWRASSSIDGWFVLAQTFFPGWHAHIDGADTPLLRANYAFTALALPAGEHEIELTYEPSSFAIGRALSAASALLGAVAWFALYRARLRRS